MTPVPKVPNAGTVPPLAVKPTDPPEQIVLLGGVTVTEDGDTLTVTETAEEVALQLPEVTTTV